METTQEVKRIVQNHNKELSEKLQSLNIYSQFTMGRVYQTIEFGTKTRFIYLYPSLQGSCLIQAVVVPLTQRFTRKGVYSTTKLTISKNNVYQDLGAFDDKEGCIMKVNEFDADIKFPESNNWLNIGLYY